METIIFDILNAQHDYQFMARSCETGKLKIGYVVIDKPWYSPPDAWKYFIFSNNYGANGFCGGSSDLGLTKVEVLKETIVPFNQTAEVMYNKEIGVTTKLVHEILGEEYVVAIINPEDDIPELWK